MQGPIIIASGSYDKHLFNIYNDGHGLVTKLDMGYNENTLFNDNKDKQIGKLKEEGKSVLIVSLKDKLREICDILVKLFGFSLNKFGERDTLFNQIGNDMAFDFNELMNVINKDIFMDCLWKTVWCDCIYKKYIINSKYDVIVITDCNSAEELKYFEDIDYVNKKINKNKKTKCLLVLSGEAGSGKDTMADYLIKLINIKNMTVIKIALADRLKLVCHKLVKIFMGIDVPFEYFFDNKIKDKILLEYPYFKGQPFKIRTILQEIGTNVFREAMWADVWCDYVYKNHLIKDIYDFIIVSDCRFPTEFEYVIKLDIFDIIKTCRIDRPETGKVIGGDNSKHISETQIMSLPVDKVIKNDSTKESFYGKIDIYFNYVILLNEFV